jgi:hypothetical protein
MDVCRAYVERGALNLGQFSCGCTPLICALFSGRVDIVNFLIDHGASTAGIACTDHLRENRLPAQFEWSKARAPYIAVHNLDFNPLLGKLLAECLMHDDHWAWSSWSLVHVAVDVNPAAVDIIGTHLAACWEWYA